MHYTLLALVVFLSGFGSSFSSAETDDAKRLYENYQASIYQIRLIEKGSGNKASIGSGFQVSPDGYVISNYHVVADAVNKPDRYLIEYLDASGEKGELQLVDVDVIHDLAVLRHGLSGRHWLKLYQGKLFKGTRLFSLGNPHDLGMTVMEGTYNGLVDGSYYERILFGGSLNPGMSGGPTINRNGEVVGVNVATAGNQISFLVPTKYLERLFARAETALEPELSWNERIEQQLKLNQQEIFGPLLEAPWPLEPLGELTVAAEVSDFVKCWGDTDQSEKSLFTVTHRICQMEESIYLGRRLTTGVFRYEYQWFETESLNQFQFYNQMQRGFYLEQANSTRKVSVTPFQCEESFLNSGGVDWKSFLCVRRYKKFPSLFDVSLTMASLAKKNRGLVASLAAAGVDRANARQMVERFMESIQWTSL